MLEKSDCTRNPPSEDTVSPNPVATLKSLESTERVALARMGYADVADARRRDIEVRKRAPAERYRRDRP